MFIIEKSLWRWSLYGLISTHKFSQTIMETNYTHVKISKVDLSASYSKINVSDKTQVRWLSRNSFISHLENVFDNMDHSKNDWISLLILKIIIQRRRM